MKKKYLVTGVCSLLLWLGAAGTSAAQTNYVLGAQDVVTIVVFGEPDLSRKYTIEQDGTFTFPHIGRVTARGLTLRALEAELKKQLAAGYLRDPQISVAVEAYRSQKILVMGQVAQPGEYQLTGDMTLLAAIAKAGSVTSMAGREVVIVRAARKPGASKGEPPTDSEILRIDLAELQGGNMALNIPLQDGDNINIPKAQSIFVTGQVKSPGGYAVEPRHDGAAGDRALRRRHRPRNDATSPYPPNRRRQTKRTQGQAVRRRPAGRHHHRRRTHFLGRAMNKVDRSRIPVVAGGTSVTEDKHIWDYLRVLYKRRWIAIPAFLVVFVTMTVNTLRETPVYQARAQVLIEKDAPSVATLDQMFQSQDAWFNDDFYQTQNRILQSRSLAKKTIDMMKLWDAPRLGNGPVQTSPISVTGTIWSCGRRNDCVGETAFQEPRDGRPRRPAASRGAGADRRDPEGVGTHRRVPGRADGRAGSKHPHRRDPLHVDRSRIRLRGGQRAGGRLHAAEHGIQVLGLERRRRLPGGSPRRAAQGHRGQRAGPAGIQGAQRHRVDRRRQFRERDPAPHGPQHGADQGEDGTHQQGSAVQPAQERPRQPVRSRTFRRSFRTNTSRA